MSLRKIKLPGLVIEYDRTETNQTSPESISFEINPGLSHVCVITSSVISLTYLTSLGLSPYL